MQVYNNNNFLHWYKGYKILAWETKHVNPNIWWGLWEMQKIKKKMPLLIWVCFRTHSIADIWAKFSICIELSPSLPWVLESLIKRLVGTALLIPNEMVIDTMYEGFYALSLLWAQWFLVWFNPFMAMHSVGVFYFCFK